jgi:hypothetical protein
MLNSFIFRFLKERSRGRVRYWPGILRAVREAPVVLDLTFPRSRHNSHIMRFGSKAVNPMRYFETIGQTRCPGICGKRRRAFVATLSHGVNWIAKSRTWHGGFTGESVA